METHMDEPCDICGDIGVVDAIQTCYVCKISREHAYCMKTYCPDIPLYWRCEECEHSSEMLASQSGLKDLPKAPTLNSSGTVHQNAKISGGVTKLSTHPGRSRRYREKWVAQGKTKYIPCQEAIKLSSGSRKLEIPLKNSSRSGPEPSKTIPTRCERPSIRPAVISPKITSFGVKANPTFGVKGQSNPPTPDATVAQKSVSLTELKVNKAARHPRNDASQSRYPLDEDKNPKEVESANAEAEVGLGKASAFSNHGSLGPPPNNTGGNACINGEPRSSNAEERNQVIEPRSSNAEERNQKATAPRSSNAEERNQKVTLCEIEKYSQSLPSLHAYWKGSFKLPDGLKHLELNNGFNAHPPSKVHLKIYEVLKKMPGVLDFELVPRFKVLTDIFKDFCPDKDDIGLYFFPGSKSSESYISLHEFIWTEKLAMRSYLNGVELFVLTSRVLHPDFQTLNGKYYLWGVFRRVRKDQASQDKDKELSLIVHPSNGQHDSIVGVSEVEDMDIELMNGSGVGYIAAKPLRNWQPWSEVPPGFEGSPRPWLKKDSLKEDQLQKTLCLDSAVASGDNRGCLSNIVKTEVLL